MASRAKAMLRLLKSKGYRLGLLTKGDPHVQQKRIAESNLANFFDAISIVNLKSRDSFRDVVDQLGGTPLSTWSIGNSLKSDILPALSAGLRAIWLDAHVWEYERDHTCVPPSEVVRAAALSEAIDAILSRKHAPNPSQHGASSPAGEPC
jgi:putative hydrolase of the HAD superfamily